MKTYLLLITLSLAILLAGCIAKAEMVKEMKTEEHVVLINPFTVPEGKIQESIVFWEKARDYLKKQPGYVSTKLHKSLKPDATFELINVAVWESAEAFMAASQKMRSELKVQPVEGLMSDPALFEVIRK